jgi:hypothetical protein
MASRLPRNRKPADQLRRRSAPETWTILPAAGCSIVAPKWPLEKASKSEADLWKRLWSAPVACWWHEMALEPMVVSRYVRLSIAKPEHASVSRLESELGLTPAALQRLRLVVEPVDPDRDAPAAADPYAHLKGGA